MRTIAYADSSFLLSLHVNDAHAPAARRFMTRHAGALPFNPLHRLEVFNATRLLVFRGEMTRKEQKAAIRQIEEDLADGLLLKEPMPWTDALRKAEQLSSDHAEKLGTRSADTIHVAAAVLCGAKQFLSFDKCQRTLAIAAGLAVNP